MCCSVVLNSAPGGSKDPIGASQGPSGRDCVYAVGLSKWLGFYPTFQMPLVVRTTRAIAGDVRDVGSIPGSRRYPGGGLGNPFQYPCLRNPMDRGAWWVTVQRVSKSRTYLKQLRADEPCHSRTSLLSFILSARQPSV